MDNTIKIMLSLLSVGFMALILWLGWGWLNHQQQHWTKYCTAYTKLISIHPTNHDNGKYSDEQYIAKWANGTTTGEDQGSIPPYRCTTTKKVPDSERQPGWKIQNIYGTTDWSS